MGEAFIRAVPSKSPGLGGPCPTIGFISTLQDEGDGAVLMVAYMNREALLEIVERRRGVFFSRSRKKMRRKGEESGHHQEVKSIALDRDEVLFDPANVYKK
jgi:phosphoribosyl-AMP cyclohydrolase